MRSVAALMLLMVGGSAFALSPVMGSLITAARDTLLSLLGLLTVAGLAVWAARHIYRHFALGGTMSQAAFSRMSAAYERSKGK